ncbi:MAG: hypothetical protein IOD05_09385 [Rhodobacter sp.]|jgi:hypothetical protein|uniref:hypothetical protein n=1 Tax=Novosphingobium sp. TaxID=1874826 RepID=UPI002A3ECB08|nr:hypothetical protein [Rhodobacter sp.]MCA3455329.1 hypothetical protein [Rhodobacter sp.]MCA3455797.1 hypothetical protein [Rhodobacter sp.]MCA3461293.1 hypothetical protein [Rhodobacter sp.]MCA3464422.1 hypothetical protein [Rhodobacter sp.]
MVGESVTSELLYELLKAIRGDIARLGERLERVEGELRVLRGHVAALVQSDLNRGSEFASLVMRVDRIERRLELQDGNS